MHVDYTIWGWVHLVLGSSWLPPASGSWSAGCGLGSSACSLALLSAVVNIVFISAYPIWSTIMIAVDILVIWAMTVHGREMGPTGA